MPPRVMETDQGWNVGNAQSKNSTSRDGQESGIKARKSVSFQDTVRYRGIPPLTEMNDEDLSNLWYNDEEYAEIKQIVSSTVKKAGSGDSVDESEGVCMRGLEGRTKFGARRRKNNKAAALDAVWKTQTALWRRKLDNPLAIAAAYKPHSTHAKYRALQCGYIDEVFVNKHIRISE